MTAFVFWGISENNWIFFFLPYVWCSFKLYNTKQIVAQSLTCLVAEAISSFVGSHGNRDGRDLMRSPSSAPCSRQVPPWLNHTANHPSNLVLKTSGDRESTFLKPALTSLPNFRKIAHRLLSQRKLELTYFSVIFLCHVVNIQQLEAFLSLCVTISLNLELLYWLVLQFRVPLTIMVLHLPDLTWLALYIKWLLLGYLHPLSSPCPFPHEGSNWECQHSFWKLYILNFPQKMGIGKEEEMGHF